MLYKQPNFYKQTILLTSIILLSACSKGPNYDNDNFASTTSVDESVAASEPTEDSKSVAPDNIESQALANKTHFTADLQQRQFIKTAIADLQVKDVYKTAILLEDMAIGHGGFVINNRITNEIHHSQTAKIEEGTRTIVESYKPIGTLTLRLPHDKIQIFLRNMIKQTKFMYSRNFNAEDVLFDIIKQQKLATIQTNTSNEIGEHIQDSDKLADKLNASHSRAQSQTNAVLSEIQKMEIQDKVAFSTITIALRQSVIVHTYTEPYLPYYVKQVQPSFQEQVNRNIASSWQNFKNFLAGLLYLLPFIIFFSFMIFISRKLYNRFKSKINDNEKSAKK